MTSFFDKLNLRPAERRVLVVVALAVFVVINLLWVWPRFGDWKKTQDRFAEIHDKLSTNYNPVIKDEAMYRKKLAEFESGSELVPAEEQVTTFIRTFQSQAAQCGVMIQGTARTSIRTNENFVEHTQSIPVMGDEDALVKFLYRLGAGDSAVPIRVKELSLHPLPPQNQKLQGTVTLVASFQRKLNLRAPAPAAKPAAAAAKLPVTATNRPPAAATNKPGSKPLLAAPATTNKPPTQPKK